jgi:hypothetical protein
MAKILKEQMEAFWMSKEKVKWYNKLKMGTRKTGVYREFGLANYAIQQFGKTEPKFLVRLNQQ